MKYIVFAVVVGILVLAAVVVYALNSGVFSAKKERDQALLERDSALELFETARTSLINIAADLAGNPQAVAASALDDIQAMIKKNKELNR